jgi:hypothetical protein
MGKHNNTTTMKLRSLIISIFFLLSLTACDDFVKNALTDETYIDTLKQNIGGELIRNIHYSNDFQSWDFDIQYSYKDKFDSIYIIGSGNYHGQSLPKNEQLIQLENWVILNTNNGFHCKIIIGLLKTNNWTEFEISPQTIEKDIVWQRQNINSNPNTGDSKVTIEKLNTKGDFSVIYKFAKKDRIFSFMTGKRRVKYKINLETGRPEMTSVSKL